MAREKTPAAEWTRSSQRAGGYAPLHLRTVAEHARALEASLHIENYALRIEIDRKPRVIRVQGKVVHPYVVCLWPWQWNGQ